MMALEGLGLGFLYNLGKDVYRKVRGRRPEEKIALRQKWKPIFDERIRDTFAGGLRSDIIIRDVRRVDRYPDVDERSKGISPWFRVGLAGLYHRGILVGLRFQSLVPLGDGRFRVLDHERDGDEVKERAVRVMLAGLIPFENIESVDMEGDEYYSYPHIFCHFANKREPYEEVGFFEERQLFPDSLPYHTKIADYEAVKVESIKFGTKPVFI